MQSKGCSIVSQNQDDQQGVPFDFKLVNAKILGQLDHCISSKSFNGFNSYLLFLTLTLDNCTSGLTLKFQMADIKFPITCNLIKHKE